MLLQRTSFDFSSSVAKKHDKPTLDSFVPDRQTDFKIFVFRVFETIRSFVVVVDSYCQSQTRDHRIRDKKKQQKTLANDKDDDGGDNCGYFPPLKLLAAGRKSSKSDRFQKRKLLKFCFGFVCSRRDGHQSSEPSSLTFALHSPVSNSCSPPVCVCKWKRIRCET